ncbi:MAG: hypothetical protein HOP07_04990 [Bacteriovoracaceae bacterium]|nr:hypothetical protein [Bacteriovoracaceae bacterium]
MTSIDINPTIEILPEHIIDQIKAGEVLERPASLLKELIENSLDANSTEINIHLIDQGMDLLSIEDNGTGINFANLPYAFLRHATSKLKNFEDLYRLRSFGFRGEALASVAASARVTCTSQPKNLNEDGGKIIINGGATELLIAQKSSSQGTSIFIKDLFFNTPARLKFVKSKVSEKAALKKMIYSFVLSHPQVTFSIKWDEKEKEIFKAVDIDKNSERVAQVFFSKKIDNRELQNNLIMTQQVYDNYKVTTYFTRTTYTTPQYRHHYLFVNKRFFQDKSLHLAVIRNLESFWRFGESGHYFVDITTPAEDIDVNVHPNKTQIKFLRADVVYSLLTTSLKSKVKLLNNSLNESLAPSIESQNAQDSFFNRSENQDHYLQNLNQSSTQWSHSPIQLHSINDQENVKNIYFNQYLIIGNNQPVLIDLKKWLSFFISDGFDKFMENEETPSPLLISEPFKMALGIIDNNLEEFKPLGLEFDRLNNDFLVLRTIPSFLPQPLIIPVTLILLKYFSLQKNKKYSMQLFTDFFEEEYSLKDLELIPDYLTDEILLSDINTVSTRLFATVITAEKFKKMFSL